MNIAIVYYTHPSLALPIAVDTHWRTSASPSTPTFTEYTDRAHDSRAAHPPCCPYLCGYFNWTLTQIPIRFY